MALRPHMIFIVSIRQQTDARRNVKSYCADFSAHRTASRGTRRPPGFGSRRGAPAAEGGQQPVGEVRGTRHAAGASPAVAGAEGGGSGGGEGAQWAAANGSGVDRWCRKKGSHVPRTFGSEDWTQLCDAIMGTIGEKLRGKFGGAIGEYNRKFLVVFFDLNFFYLTEEAVQFGHPTVHGHSWVKERTFPGGNPWQPLTPVVNMERGEQIKETQIDK